VGKADACLSTLGKALLGVDEVAETQIAVCRTYAEEIMMLDMNIVDFHLGQLQGPSARCAGLWRDDNVKPIMQQEKNGVASDLLAR
jgi:hypothetical protein